MPPTTKGRGSSSKELPAARAETNYRPSEMLKTWQFYVLWFMYACGAGAGLMIISKLAKIASVQAGIELGFVLVVALAVGNGIGRIITGIVSDKIGRKATLLICFVLQTILILLLSQTTKGSPLANATVLAVVSALIGANFGANLALFPAFTTDYYGLKNFGVNYGLVFYGLGFWWLHARAVGRQGLRCNRKFHFCLLLLSSAIGHRSSCDMHRKVTASRKRRINHADAFLEVCNQH